MDSALLKDTQLESVEGATGLEPATDKWQVCPLFQLSYTLNPLKQPS